MDSKGALAELKSFQGSRKGAGDYYSQYQKELGVGDAQARSSDIRSQLRQTETALKGVGESVAGRTRGQGVNEAQRARLVGLERAPIAEEMGGLQGAFADEQTNYRDLLGQATTRAGQAYQTDADRLAGLESNYAKLYQQEQAAAEQARWQRQLEDEQRRWQADFDERKRQSALSQQNIRNQYAQQASLLNRFNTPAATPAKTAAPAQPFYDNNGQILGYESNTQGTQLTAAGIKAEDDYWKKENRNWAQKALGGVGDWTGWF